MWIPIKGYEEKYIVSDEGEIISLNYNNTGVPRKLKPKKNKQGYLEITLSKNNKAKAFMLSRIVIENYTDLKLRKNDIVMYKDGNSENCALENMLLITRGKRQEITYDQDHRERYKFNYYGKELPIKEIAKMNNTSEETIRQRLKQGWCIYESAEIPKGVYKKCNTDMKMKDITVKI